MNVIHANSPCQRVRPLLDSYVSNELLVETTNDVLRHIGDCPECRGALHEIEATRHAVRRAVSTIQPPPELRGRILRSLAGNQPVVMPKRSAAPRWLAVAAAVAAVVLSIGIIRNLTLHRSASPSLLHIGWLDHKECVMAGHIPTTPPARETAVTKLAAYSELLPEIERQMPGYVMRQAHRCTIFGRQYTHVVMEKNGVMVSVSLVRKNPGEAMTPGLHSATIEGTAVYGFETGDHLAFVMANQDKDTVHGLAAKLSPSIRQITETL